MEPKRENRENGKEWSQTLREGRISRRLKEMAGGEISSENVMEVKEVCLRSGTK